MPKVASLPPPPAASTASAAPEVAATRDDILDAAERMFAEHGYAGATLRLITAAARVNLAAAHYHFGDKEALYRAVFTRRIQPMNTLRLADLEAAEAAAGKRPVPLRTLLVILIRPIAALLDTAGTGVHPFARVMARLIVEPPPFMEKIVAAEFGSVIARFVPHFLRALPHLDPATLLWRARFVLGAANVTFGRMRLIERRLQEIGAPTDGDTILAQLVAFAEAGLGAPAALPLPASP
ncbi:MAG: TetR/AcrR family transcriptional regulator [Burkholderiales bacterium]|nr:TetR/AcrR family transcriptional regulator [Opitutaceae bacterium]